MVLAPGPPGQRTARRGLLEHLCYKYAGLYRNEPGGPVYDLLLLQVDSEHFPQ
ncbi:hypothetical protein OG542_00720 [Streptomyces violaceus]|uniref:hypothetical protein n=1 Tax=Streptomyces violaceus TaxID=1936 RepID=UPI002E1B24A3